MCPSPAALLEQRRRAIRATGGTVPGRCPSTVLAAALRQEDPAIELRRQSITGWLNFGFYYQPGTYPYPYVGHRLIAMAILGTSS
eukprot:3143191-Pyramimonas_sp.AAC.1